MSGDKAFKAKMNSLVTHPYFKIETDFHQDFRMEFLYEQQDNPVSEKILQTFKDKRIQLDKNVNPVVEKDKERWTLKGNRNKWYQVLKTESGFEVFRGYSRYYTSTIIPTLILPDQENNKDILLDIYKEVCSSWKMLTDVRFKLLGLVPAVSVVAWGQLISSEIFKTIPGAYAGILIAIFGFFITGALRIYDKRNDSLYNDLISRGRKIEEELGVDTGIHRGRVNPTSWWIRHSIPVMIIYGAAMLGWLSTGIWFILHVSKLL